MIEGFRFDSLAGAARRFLMAERDDYLAFATKLGEVEIFSFGRHLHRWRVRLSAVRFWERRRGWYLGSRLMCVHKAEYALISASTDILSRGERMTVADTAWGRLGREPPDDPKDEHNVRDERPWSEDGWPRIVARCTQGHFGVCEIEALTPVILHSDRELDDKCNRCGKKMVVASGVYEVAEDHVHRRSDSKRIADIPLRPE